MLTGILVFLGLTSGAGIRNSGISSEEFVAVLMLFFVVTFLFMFSHFLLFIMAIGKQKKKGETTTD